MRAVSNMDELARALQPLLMEMVDQMAERVYETLNYFLRDYYEGWTPDSYRRTEAFLRSAVKVKAKPCKDGAVAYVYIDYNSMNEYVNITGYQVAEWANTGKDGGLSVRRKSHVWDETMENTIENGELLKLAIQCLRNKGFTINV